MKFSKNIVWVLAAASIGMYAFMYVPNKEPWTASQLMPAAELAKIINNAKSEKPIIYSVGPGADIKGSIEIGAVQETENYTKFKEVISTLDRKTCIVLVCGCCPFEHCPNIRPAFDLLNELKFTNHKLLNLSNNLKTDWIDQSFPLK